MPWNQDAFEEACEAFQRRYDGFVNFENPGEKYQSEERAFKEELIALYSENVRPLIDGDPRDFLNAYHDLVNSNLQSRRPKDFKGWRTLSFFERIPETKKSEFGKILQDLLQGNDIFEAFEVYGKESFQLLQEDPGALRICGGILMTLHRPESFMYAILKVWNAANKKLTGHYTLLPNRFVINGEVTRACQGLAKQVRNALAEKGWRPRDMLGVQSFLWSIHEEDLEHRRKGRKNVESAQLPLPSVKTLSLDEISARIRAKGMRIDHRTLRRYHSAMRTRGFVILAGPSGTGKTWLASLYASAIGAKSVVAPVAPNWASNEDLLGYFNPIEDKFHATSFLEFIDTAVEAWERSGKDAPEYHLVLDEMNLARIEHYFSLFLSLMERRREMEMPEASMTGRPSIRIPPNLKFVGTVNMDETTHGFADKVFDRAQLIELSIDRASAQEHITQKLENEPAEALIALWDAMASASPVGFRVLDDIADYLEEARKCGASWQEALDDQIVSKLLPKLRGIDPETSEALKGIADLAKEGQYLLAEAKCKEMLRRYERTDVVSFF